MKTSSYAAMSADQPLVPYTFERRTPGPRDVAIDIAFCGICHSDIHTARSEWGPTRYPCVPGHEIVGRVRAVGDEVTRFRAGDTVGVGCLVDSCRTCGSCAADLEQYCDRGWTGTYGSTLPDGDYTLGGYSQHIVMDEHFVLRIPEGLDLAAAAPLLCAGITTYSPLRHLRVGPQHKVAIMGLGGLGHMGVKLAASFEAEVTVLSRSEHKRADAERLGAHRFVSTADEAALAAEMGRFDVILDTVSAKHDLNLPINLLARDGHLVLLGVPSEALDLAAFGVIFRRRNVMGSLIGGLAETQEMLDHCAQHGIVSDIETITADRINEAYERTLASDVKYRFVIDCSTLNCSTSGRS